MSTISTQHALRILFASLSLLSLGCAHTEPITLRWDKNILSILHPDIPVGVIEVNYLEAYCRPGSTDRDWHQTVIGHKTHLVSSSKDGKQIKLQCTLTDGVVVNHLITAHKDHVAFHLTAHNPTDHPSQAHWAQPCIRLGDFIGKDQTTYIQNCFVIEDGRLTRMPTRDWATNARYTPGQVWAAQGVNRNDVNPRPLNPHTAQRGLIGAFSGDGNWVIASAWEPYQELFQGVIQCVHSDLRIAGLEPRQTKNIRGKIYLMPAHEKQLLNRYTHDFPEHNPPPATR